MDSSPEADPTDRMGSAFSGHDEARPRGNAALGALCFHSESIRMTVSATSMLSFAVFQGVGLDMTRCTSDVKKLLQTAFSQPIRPVEDDLRELQEQRLISLDEAGNAVATQLGRATLASSLQQTLAIRVYNDLQTAMRSLCLDSELHMLFLVDYD